MYETSGNLKQGSVEGARKSLRVGNEYSLGDPKTTFAGQADISGKVDSVATSFGAPALISGQRIAVSGLYGVSHDVHLLPAQVTLVKGQAFPRCAECETPVRFTLLRPMRHLDKLRGNIILDSLPVLHKKAA